MDAFDADVLIYAATAVHPLGQRVAGVLLAGHSDDRRHIGSVLLLPEVLSTPMRELDEDDPEFVALLSLLAQLDLRPVDRTIAELAKQLGAAHRLRAADAAHLATAVAAGADRFITNNRKDFPQSIREVDVTYPTDLPARAPGV